MRLLVGGLLLLLALPPLLRAQDSVIVIDPDLPPGDSAVVRAGPPPDVVAELLAFYNDCATTRMQGDVSFPAGSAFAGRLALFRGSLRIAGRVRGDVVVVNATLYLLPGRGRGGRRAGRGRPPDPKSRAPATSGASGCSGTRRRCSARTGRARSCCASGAARWASWPPRAPASRPAACAPRCCSRPAAPTTGSRGCRSSSARRSSSAHPQRPLARLDLRGILRTAGEGSRLSSDFGYGARAELRFPGGRRRRPALQRGGAVRGPAALGGGERLVGLPAAARLPRLVRAARRRRRGLGTADPRRSGSRCRSGATTSARVRATDPWSLLRNSDRWRRNPLSDDGHYFTTGLQVDLDTRNDRELPSTGWLLRGRYEHSTSDDVAPVALPETRAPADLRPAAATPSTGSRSISGATRGSRPACGSTPASAPTAGSAATGCRSSGASRSAAPTCCRVRIPRLHLRAPRASATPRTRRSATARSPPRSRSAPGSGSTSAIACATARAAPRAIHRHRGGGPRLPRRRRQGVARGRRARARCPVNRIPSFREWKADVGVGLDAGADRRVPRQEPRARDEPVRFLVRLQRRF